MEFNTHGRTRVISLAGDRKAVALMRVRVCVSGWGGAACATQCVSNCTQFLSNQMLFETLGNFIVKLR